MHLVTTLSQRGKRVCMEWTGHTHTHTHWFSNALGLVTEVTQSGSEISRDKTFLSHRLLFPRPSPPLTFPRQQCGIVDCWATFLRWRFAGMSKWNISPRADPLYLRGEPGPSSQQLHGLIYKWVFGGFWSKEAGLKQSPVACVCVFLDMLHSKDQYSRLTRRGKIVELFALLPLSKKALDSGEAEKNILSLVFPRQIPKREPARASEGV